MLARFGADPETGGGEGILDRSGLRELSPEAARGLTSREGRAFQGTLDLSGLRTLPPEVARGLRHHSGQLLLEDLEAITPEAATAPLAVSVARALGRHTGPSLLIAELESLDPAAAAELARHPGDLQFPHLTTLSAETAAALAMHTGGISLPKVRDLPADVAERLAAGRPQAAEDPSVGGFSLLGLQTWDPEVIRPLLATRRASLGQWSLSTLTPEQAAALAVASGDLPLELPGIFRLDDPDAVLVARELARTRGLLALPNLETVSPEALAALAQAADIEIPPLEELRIIPLSDGNGSPSVAIPERFRSP